MANALLELCKRNQTIRSPPRPNEAYLLIACESETGANSDCAKYLSNCANAMAMPDAILSIFFVIIELYGFFLIVTATLYLTALALA